MKKDPDSEYPFAEAGLQAQPTGRLLILLFRRFEEDLVRRLEEKGYGDVGLAQLNVVRHLPPEGAQVVELARWAGLTKQAIGKLVAELREAGYLTTRPHEDDGRAVKVTFSRKGERLVQDAITIIRGIEARYAARIGDDALARMRASLIELLEV